MESFIGKPFQGDAGGKLGAVYSELLGMSIVRHDWVKVGVDRDTYPQLAFGDGGSNTAPPSWPDPERPQQLHLDITVPDLDEAEALVLSLGGKRRRPLPGLRGPVRSSVLPVSR
jgi:hypothetical protein